VLESFRRGVQGAIPAHGAGYDLCQPRGFEFHCERLSLARQAEIVGFRFS
jgi:hypothetical protein